MSMMQLLREIFWTMAVSQEMLMYVHYLSQENTFTPSYQILSMPPTLMLALERIRMTRNVVVGGLKS